MKKKNEFLLAQSKGVSTKRKYKLILRSTLVNLIIAISVCKLSAQNTTITLRVENVPILQVMEDIKKQTSYTFSYNVELESILKRKKDYPAGKTAIHSSAITRIIQSNGYHLQDR